MLERLVLYQRLMRLDKPIGTMLLMWPTLWGLWFAANGHPNLKIFGIFVLGVVLMRSAGCIINDYADRNFDKHVKRTAHRPITSGAVSLKEAGLLTLILCLASLALALQLNTFTLQLSVAAVFLAASYPFTKRFFPLPQAYLGIAFGFGIPMAYAAHTNSVPLTAWLLLIANIFWSVAYDTAYAMVDKDDDIKIGIKTAALTFGRFDYHAIMICHVIFISIMLLCGILTHRGPIYYASFVIILYFLYDQYRLISTCEREKCFQAFLDNNWVGLTLFLGLLMDYTIQY